MKSTAAAAATAKATGKVQSAKGQVWIRGNTVEPSATTLAAAASERRSVRPPLGAKCIWNSEACNLATKWRQGIDGGVNEGRNGNETRKTFSTFETTIEGKFPVVV